MRILFLCPVGVIGGAERVLLTAVAALKRTDPNLAIRVIAPVDGPLLPAVSAAGAEVEIVPMPAILTRLGDSQLRSVGKWRGRFGLLAQAMCALPKASDYVVRMRAVITRFKPDLVHSNGIKTHLLSRFVVPTAIPVIWHIHDFYGLRPMAAWALRLARSRVRTGIAISRAVAADASKVLPGVPVKVVMNAIDLSYFCKGPGVDLDLLAGLPPATPGTVRIGLVATYARWKGHLTFLDAVQHLAQSSSTLPVRWYIVGGPIYKTVAQFGEPELRSAVAARGLQDRVGFIPFQQDPVGVYRGLDIVVHASTLPEPFGLTVAEAMACGKAVVVSAAGGAAELFTDGKDGLGVSPGDSCGIASAVNRLVVDSTYREQLGMAARATAETQFDDSHYGLQLIDVYRSLIRQYFLI
ncbi:MAG TPA: glycosyltransferase family 4 protein [Gemmata sp.]|jgi:glycosyltransferase involved in cell wall biosynthesis|nr:glycosyltransferase family 4 protein [Gemmata sp.]